MTSVGDRYPNYLSGSLKLSAANTFTTEVETLPIIRPTAGRSRSTIMEVLWVEISPSTIDLVADNDALTFTISTGAVPTSATGLEISNGNVLVYKGLDTQGADTSVVEKPLRVDLTDKNGFGQLIATDRVNINGFTVGQALASTFHWRIYYRFVTVSDREYIGIVQSQTSG